MLALEKLANSGKTVVVVGLAPIVIGGAIDHGQSAQNVYSFVIKSDVNATYDLNGRKISAKYWEIPNNPSKLGFFAFEVNGVRYLVAKQNMSYGIVELIDGASFPNGYVDGVLDDVMVQKGTKPKEHRDPKKDSTFGGLYHADTLLAELTMAPRIPFPPKTPNRRPIHNKNQI